VEPNVDELEREIERQFKAHKIQCTVPRSHLKRAIEGSNREWSDASFIPLAQRGEANRILKQIFKEYMQDFRGWKPPKKDKKDKKA